MGLDKKSKKADKIANLYRAALYLGLGKTKAGLNFLKKTNFKIKNQTLKNLKTSQQQQQQLLLAEKILDQYHKERFSL